MFSLTDQTGRTISLNTPSQRIISLVPSQTELLHDLGLNDEVIGITRFCIHPKEWFQTKTRVGGTKAIKLDLIRQMKPDLIIANKEENVREQIEELAKDFPTWTSDVNTLSSAYEMIEQVGLMTGKQEVAQELIATIKTNFSRLPTSATRPDNDRISAIYLIWHNPFMTVGGDTFIHSMMEAASFQNLFADRSRYPETTIAELRELNPGLVLLSSEPFPFKQKHIEELQPHLPNSRIILVDGEMFSWYGSRLLKAPSYYKTLLETITS